MEKVLKIPYFTPKSTIFDHFWPQNPDVIFRSLGQKPPKMVKKRPKIAIFLNWGVWRDPPESRTDPSPPPPLLY